MLPSFVQVWDTYSTNGFWPSTNVTYGLPGWSSYCLWAVYEKGME
jgi:hypothetical protein